MGNKDSFINYLAKVSGGSRKQVLDVLKRMSQMPEVQKEIKRNMGRHDD
jgi:hypothetical protein